MNNKLQAFTLLLSFFVDPFTEFHLKITVARFNAALTLRMSRTTMYDYKPRPQVGDLIDDLGDKLSSVVRLENLSRTEVAEDLCQLLCNFSCSFGCQRVGPAVFGEVVSCMKDPFVVFIMSVRST